MGIDFFLSFSRPRAGIQSNTHKTFLDPRTASEDDRLGV